MGSLLPHQFFRDLRQENDVFQNLFARHPTDVQLSTGGAAEPDAAEIVSGSDFPALDTRPALGRLFGDDDDVLVDGHPVVVLSHDYWRTRLIGDPQIVGKRVLVNGLPMMVIGVAEPRFRGVAWATVPAVWIPLMMKRQPRRGGTASSSRACAGCTCSAG